MQNLHKQHSKQTLRRLITTMLVYCLMLSIVYTARAITIGIKQQVNQYEQQRISANDARKMAQKNVEITTTVQKQCITSSKENQAKHEITQNAKKSTKVQIVTIRQKYQLEPVALAKVNKVMVTSIEEKTDSMQTLEKSVVQNNMPKWKNGKYVLEENIPKPQTIQEAFENANYTLYDLEPFLKGSCEEKANLVIEFLAREAVISTTSNEKEQKRIEAIEKIWQDENATIADAVHLLKGKYADNLWLLSRLIRGESLDLTDEVQQAQAWVIITRALSTQLSDGTGDIANAIFRGRQYSCVWDGSFWKEPNEQCIKNAEDYLNGNILEPEKKLNGFFIGTAPENKKIVDRYEVQNWEIDSSKDIVTIYICDKHY